MGLEANTVLLIETAVVIKNQVWISLSSLLDPTVLSVNLSKDWFATGEGPLVSEHECLFSSSLVVFGNYHFGGFLFVLGFVFSCPLLLNFYTAVWLKCPQQQWSSIILDPSHTKKNGKRVRFVPCFGDLILNSDELLIQKDRVDRWSIRVRERESSLYDNGMCNNLILN